MEAKFLLTVREGRYKYGKEETKMKTGILEWNCRYPYELRVCSFRFFKKLMATWD